MRPWGLPPKYGVYPISILERTDVPAYLKLTYITLYALAWRTEHSSVLQSMAQLTELFSQLEGKPISERALRKRMQEMARLGLVSRIFTGSRWITRLLLRHEYTEMSTGPRRTSPAAGGTSSIEDDDIDIDIPIQQHQFSICGPDRTSLAVPGDAEAQAIREELWSMGIDEPVATELALLEHVTSNYIDEWAAYLGYQAARGNRLGAGWLILQIRSGRRAPAAVRGRVTRK